MAKNLKTFSATAKQKLLVHQSPSSSTTYQNKEYYVSELVGCIVQNSSNEELGTITKVDNFGAGDLLEVQNSKNKKFYIPFDKNNLISNGKDNIKDRAMNKALELAS